MQILNYIGFILCFSFYSALAILCLIDLRIVQAFTGINWLEKDTTASKNYNQLGIYMLTCC